MNSETGGSEDRKAVSIAEASGAYTAWVSKGVDNFSSTGEAILVRGTYRLLDAEDIRTFSTTVEF